MMKLRILVCCALLPAAIGCQTLDFDLRKNIPWGHGADGELEPPVKLAAMWTDTVLNSAGASSTRGFGGRLMFYASDDSKPVEVKGTLEVYAFDETDRDQENTRPDRKYVFTPEQFEKHHSKSALGHSYSVWIPWDAAGGPQREVSLLVRFTPHKGPIVVGEASKQVLPGATATDLGQKKKSKTASEAGASTASASGEGGALGAVQPVSYDAALPGGMPLGGPSTGAGSGRRMSTTTISLPQIHAARPNPMDGAFHGEEAPAGLVPQAAGLVLQAADVRTALPSAQLASAASQAWPNSTAYPQTAYSQAAYSQAMSPGAAGRPLQAGAAPQIASGQQVAQATGWGAPLSATHFGPQRHRVLGAPIARLDRGHVPWQRTPSGPQSPLPAGPESAPGVQSVSIASADPRASR